MSKVIRTIVEAAASGELAIVTRPMIAELISPHPRSIGISKPRSGQYFDCQMNPDKPLNSGLSAHDMLTGKNPRISAWPRMDICRRRRV